MDLPQMVREALGRPCNCGGIDAVGAWSHFAPEPACSKRQIGVKRIHQLLPNRGIRGAVVQPPLDQFPRHIVMRQLGPGPGLGDDFIEKCIVLHQDKGPPSRFKFQVDLSASSVQ